jgi:hypothetical protein
MISTAPVMAANDLVAVRDKVSAFIAIAKMKARDGITVSEFGELAVALLRIVIAAVDALPVEGHQRKQMAVEAAGMLFDAMADKCVPALVYPAWVILRPAARSLFLLFVDGAIESLLPLVRIAA